jgi:HEPN domain-containing protein/predicted nucleotidyltransferase
VLTTLEAVVDRLVRLYEPDRIILFGSRAKGVASTDSDFDLVVVKDSDQRPLDRGIEIERLLVDRAIPLDLTVHTPVEVRALYAQGSPFIDEVFSTGKVLYMRKTTSAWVTDAEGELAMARLLLENAMLRGACLHAQQAVEKGLKALLIERAEPVPHAHDLVDLLRRVTAVGWPVPLDTDDAVFLNRIYRGRYPTDEGLLPHGEPTPEEASRAVRAADEVSAFLGSALASREPSPHDKAVADAQASPTDHRADAGEGTMSGPPRRNGLE